MHSKGVPVISILIRNDTQSKIFRIGDTLKDVVEEGNDQTPFTGILRGIQLEARENDANRGDVVYDNIPTIGYWNAGCGMANVSGEDYQVDQLLLEGENGEYRIIDAQHLQYVEIYNEDQDAWINATEAEIAEYISSINSDAITTITHGTGNVIDAVINTTSGLDIGLIEFLTGIEGLKSVKYTAGSQSYVMTIGDETSYETFQKGVLASMPNTNGASVNGSVELNAENTASLVYTLNVSYFNQAEEFKKVDAYLDSYTGEDAAVSKTADKEYDVITHVDVVENLLFDIFPTISGIKNLSNVKVTIGEQVINNTDVTALKNFVNAALHFEKSWDPVVIAVEITAGEETATYTLTYVSDYSVVDAVNAIMGPVFAPVDNDQITLSEESADGITWNVLNLKVDPQDLTDTTGFVDALKALPHVAQIIVNMGNSGHQTIAAPFDDTKIAQIRDIIVNNAPKSVADTQNVIFGFTPGFGNFVNPSSHESISYSGFANSVFDPEAKIGEHGYATVAQAFAAAKSGETVTLAKNITVSNNAVNTTPNNPVMTVPDGITFDGAEHTITADEATWVGNNANHVLGASNVAGTIKNLNIVGHANTKSGIVCFGQSGNVTLENVDVQNCGNCGVQVAGATVSATSLTTSGNVWGGVNADMGSDGSTPALTIGDGCTFAEKAEVYTEITDQDVVTAPSMTKVQGFGKTLKGFIYYTTDMSRLGTITNDDGTIVYEDLAAAAENSATVKLTAGLSGVNSIPVGGSITIDGQGNTINGQIKCEAVGSGVSSVTLKNMTLDGSGDSGVTYGIISQNQTDNGQMDCNLTLENVNISGYTSKAIYGTNIKSLTINGGKIENCATGEMDDPNTKGDYAIDLNLVAVKDAVITIDGVTFAGDLGQKAAIKITARGGASDAGASDIPKNVGEATVDHVTISNCDFSGSTTEVDFRIGTDNKTPSDPSAANTTGAYAVSLVGNTEMVVQSAYLEGEPTLTVPVGRTASKTAETDIALDLTPEEQVDDIMADIPGAEETAENTYSIVTTNGSLSDLSFFDEIAVLPGFSSMTVSDGTNEPVTYTGDGIMETFKTQVDALLPKSNDDPAVSLTLTVNFAQ